MLSGKYVSLFRRNLLQPLWKELSGSSKTLLTVLQTTWPHVLEANNLHTIYSKYHVFAPRAMLLIGLRRAWKLLFNDAPRFLNFILCEIAFSSRLYFDLLEKKTNLSINISLLILYWSLVAETKFCKAIYEPVVDRHNFALKTVSFFLYLMIYKITVRKNVWNKYFGSFCIVILWLLILFFGLVLGNVLKFHLRFY